MWYGLLPIGSVVLLEEAEVPLLIVGSCQIRMEEVQAPTRIFDYVGVPYPFGYSNPNNMIRFDHEAIDKVYSIGFINDSMVDFLPEMQRIIEGLHNGSLTVEQVRARFNQDNEPAEEQPEETAQEQTEQAEQMDTAPIE